MFSREKCLIGPISCRWMGILMDLVMRYRLVVIFACLVVKKGLLVVILTDLVVNIIDLVVIVKLWNLVSKVSQTEKAIGGSQ